MARTLWDLGWLRSREQPITAEGVAAGSCSAVRYQPL